MDQTLHENHENWYPTKIKPSTVFKFVIGKGGTIYFGISPEGCVHGVALSRDDKDEFRLGVDRLMTDKLLPSILHSSYHVEYTPVVEEGRFGQKIIPDVYVAGMLVDKL